MIPVILRSRRAGISIWAAVRGMKVLNLEGLEGNVVDVSFRLLNGEVRKERVTSEKMDLPENTKYVLLEHLTANGEPLSAVLTKE